MTDHNHDKYFANPQFNKFTKETFDIRLKRANLASKRDTANFVNNTDFHNKIKGVTQQNI